MHGFSENTLKEYKNIVFFTGAGMSAESGVPTYRGMGGIWHQYNWEEYACQQAFDSTPEKVLEFHDLRRQKIFGCKPHAGHYTLVEIEKQHSSVSIITQNIDGLHQLSGSSNVTELHGSIWRVCCDFCQDISLDYGAIYASKVCYKCNRWVRPDIVWFGDRLSTEVLRKVDNIVKKCDLFFSIGTSGVVYPAAGYLYLARSNGAKCIEINPEPTDSSPLFHHCIRGDASVILPGLFQSVD
ncbi:MAG: NAD-dependent deacylase [Candidatus Marinimicrobia bacterium]|nr:NAD-dependent deacylase [Candidatus Neomarinimicrobiota bacterium]